jgi:hypothetical protein
LALARRYIALQFLSMVHQQSTFVDKDKVWATVSADIDSGKYDTALIAASSTAVIAADPIVIAKELLKFGKSKLENNSQKSVKKTSSNLEKTLKKKEQLAIDLQREAEMNEEEQQALEHQRLLAISELQETAASIAPFFLHTMCPLPGIDVIWAFDSSKVSVEQWAAFEKKLSDTGMFCLFSIVVYSFQALFFLQLLSLKRISVSRRFWNLLSCALLKLFTFTIANTGLTNSSNALAILPPTMQSSLV